MIVLLWLLLLLTGYLILANLGSLIRAVGDVVAAIISALAVFIGAILTHALTQIREQRDRQLMEKQRNYLQLVNQLNEIIRNPHAPSDRFSTVHLESWVVGSPEIVKLTQSLLETKNREQRRKAVKNLLAKMRTEVGLAKLDESIDLKCVFPPQEGL